MSNRTKLIEKIQSTDKSWWPIYFEKRKLHDDNKLQKGLGPCPYEGDLENARIVMLLANPGFDNESLDEFRFINAHNGDHDYPFPGLNPKATGNLKKWWKSHLKALVDVLNEGKTEDEKLQIISQRVAALQLVPWASKTFDDGLIESKATGPIPSHKLMLEQAENSLARKGTIVLLMRCESNWRRSKKINHLLENKSQRQIFTPNTLRRPYVSKGNFSKSNGAWEAIIEAINRH